MRFFIFKMMYFQIEDDTAGYSMDTFCIPKHYEDDLKRVLVPAGLVADRYVYSNIYCIPNYQPVKIFS